MFEQVARAEGLLPDKSDKTDERKTRQASVAFVSFVARVRDDLRVSCSQSEIHCSQCSWSEKDWQHLYGERAAIAEHDGHAAPSEAARIARQGTVSTFLFSHLPAEAGSSCIFCMQADSGIISFVRLGERACAHTECWRASCKDAEAKLVSMGAIP